MNEGDPRLERRLRDELEAEQRAAVEEMAQFDRLLASLPAREERPPGSNRWAHRRRALAAAACLVLLATALVLRTSTRTDYSSRAGQSATVSAPGRASPSPIPSSSPSVETIPFVLDVGSAGGTREVVVAAAADCAALPSAWARQFCELTLRASWHAIAGPFDPAGPGGVNGATWQAAMARAAIDGDVSICDDAGMLLVEGFRATGATPPGTGRHRPIAACRSSLATYARAGSFVVSDPTGAGTSLTVHVSADAADRTAAAATFVPFDPSFGCVSPSHTRAYCNAVLRAVEAALSTRAATAERVAVVDADLTCFDGGSCLGPGYGKDSAGGALVDTSDAQRLAFDLERDVATGQISATQVSVPPALESPSPFPSSSRSPSGHVTKDQAIEIGRAALPTGGTPPDAIVAMLGTYGGFVPDPPAKASPPPADTPVWQVQFESRGTVQYFAIVDATTGALISSGVAVAN